MDLVSRIRRFSPTLPHYLFAGVFVLRILSLERLSRSPLFMPVRGDMHFYNDWALRILRGEFDFHAAFYGLPLYAYVLAFIYRVFGYGPFIPGFLQALADSGTAVLIYLLVVRLFESAELQSNSPAGNRVAGREITAPKFFGALAAMGWALFVPAQAYSIILMPTAWLVFVFWFVVWRIVANRTAPGWKECLLLGLLIGFTAMAIATVLFLIPLVLVAILLRSETNLGRTLGLKAGVFVLAVGIGTSPCWIHNYLIAHDPVFLSAHGGVNFWIGNNPIANGYPRFPPGLRAGQAAMLEDSISTAEAAAGHPLKRSEVSAYWSTKAHQYIAEHPADWIHLLLIKAKNFWSAFQYDDLSIITNLREQHVIFPGLYFGLLAILAFPGVVFAWRLSPVSRWITAAILLHMIALMTVFITERYRLPIVPGLIVMATFGLFVLWRSLVNAQYRGTAIYLTLLLASAILISWPQRDPALWALDAYNSGWQAYECGNLPLAEKNLTLARRYVPTNPETNFALGNLRLAQGNKPDAAAFYLTTLQYEGAHRGALNNLGVMALEENRFDLAEQWLRRAETIEPRNAKTHFLLGKVLLGKGDRPAAQREALRAIELDPAQPEFKQLSEELGPNSR